MDTQPPCAAADAEPDMDDPRLGLIAHVHDHSRSIIQAELQRLARRVPTLDLADLDVIDTALNSLSECLILHRLRNAPQHTAVLLWHLFSTAKLSHPQPRPPALRSTHGHCR